MFDRIFSILTGIMAGLIGATPILFWLLIKGNYADAYFQMPILFMGMFFSALASFFGGGYLCGTQKNKECWNHYDAFNTIELNWKSYYGYRNKIDVGKSYSKLPVIYLLYRNSYHLYRILNFYILAKKNSNDKYCMECVKLHKAVIRDSKDNKFGLCSVFYPGRKLR